MVGYDGNSNNYRLLNMVTKKITISRNVTFNEKIENNSKYDESIILLEQDSEEEEDTEQQDNPEAVNHGNNSETNNNKNFENENDNNQVSNSSNDTSYELRERREIKLPTKLADYQLNYTEYDIPQTYEEAISGPEKAEWRKAIKEEFDALISNETWKMVPKPENKNLVDSKWVFKIKPTEDKNGKHYKARLCARGFTQKEGEDYFEIFSPITKFDSIRTVLSIAAARKYNIMQFDIKTAFLNGKLNEDIYMKPPEGLKLNKDQNLVCLLQKSLYGLKQSSRCWNNTFTNFLHSYGFRSTDADPCVFVGRIKNNILLLVLYVDDGLIMSKEKNAIMDVISNLKQRFEITFSEPQSFVGIEILKNDDGSIFINQESYTRRIIKQYNMEQANPSKTPEDAHTNLFKENDVLILEKGIPFRQIIGSLMFLAVTTRPDIAHAVGVLSRFLDKYTYQHWNAAKRIIRYLIGTVNHGIFYKSISNVNLIGYSDADYGNDMITRRSTTGYLCEINESPVSWCSKRQSVVSLSTMESEYMAATQLTKQIIWLRRLINEIDEEIIDPTKIYIDNQSTIKFIRNPEFHARTKHIDIQFHFIKEKFQEGEIILPLYIPGEVQHADILTKPLPGGRFEMLKGKFMTELT
ncbi:hypothetical protein ABEB36_014972 [Hypothenemus hampei]|uniref:Reverse transcriptase Ty1/copia-type domain-containing protein n=1 Tax=Hypothenemus hampei TaxID=57062 RepID=A0ABD1E2A4_HYPHA